MQGKEYIFYLQNKANQFWQLDANGLLVCNSSEYKLQSSPSGWEEMLIEAIRNDKYFGLDRRVANELTFVKDGARILKKIHSKFGHEADCYLSICQRQLQLTGGTYNYHYDLITRSQVDFSTYKHTGAIVSIDLKEDGLLKYLKANEGIAFPLPLNVPEARYVAMDGIGLYNTVFYNLPEINQGSDGIVGFEDLATLPLFFSGSEGDSYGLTFLPINQEQITTSDTAYMAGSDNYAITNFGTIPLTFTIAGNLVFKWATNIPSGVGVPPVNIYLKTSTGTVYNIVNVPAGPWVQNNIYVYPFSFTITLAPTEKLFGFTSIKWDNDFGLIPSAIQYQETTDIQVTSVTRKPTTYVLHLPAQYVFEQLISKVTEGNYAAAISPLLTNETIWFTCGDAIRGITPAEIKISLKDFFTFWNCRFNVGMTETANGILLDRKANLIDLSSVVWLNGPALTPTFYQDDKPIFNEIEYGYPEISNEVGILNGREEFNCKVNRNIPGIFNGVKKLSFISLIRTSCYEQEINRVKLFKKDTTDNKNDNNVYANHLESALQPASGDIPAHYRLSRSLNASVTAGLIEPNTVWNLYLRPALQLDALGSFIRSSLYQCDTKNLVFISAEKNGKVEINGIADNVDINIGGLAAPYILPYKCDFDEPVNDNLMQNLALNPLQVFGFYIDGKPYLWIPQIIKSGSSAKKLQRFEFISLASNNIEELSNYEG